MVSVVVTRRRYSLFMDICLSSRSLCSERNLMGGTVGCEPCRYVGIVWQNFGRDDG